MPRTIGVILIERELSCRTSWQANTAISPEQVIQIYKELYDASFQMRYVAVSAVTDTQNNYCHP